MRVDTIVTLATLVNLVRVSAHTGLRWDIKESGGRLVRSLTDGKEIITLEYNSNDQLVQCWQSAQGKSADSISLLYYSAMSDSSAFRKDAIELDLGQLKKNCKRYMKQVLSATNSTELQEEIEMINTLREGIDGSKWCGMFPQKTKGKALKREDRCCKKWHECSLQIKAYNYEYMTYNYRPHTIVSCNCTAQLEICLRNLTMSSLAEEILEIMFDRKGYSPICLTSHKRRDQCVQWDNFYHNCEKYDWAEYGQIRTLEEYKQHIGINNPDTSQTTTQTKEEHRGGTKVEL